MRAEDSMLPLRFITCLAVFLMVAIAVSIAAPQTQPAANGRASVHNPGGSTSTPLTAEQDRARLLGLLGLKESDLRPAPVPDAKSSKATNYDEAKANVYPKLPDPMVFKSGQAVKNAADW